MNGAGARTNFRLLRLDMQMQSREKLPIRSAVKNLCRRGRVDSSPTKYNIKRRTHIIPDLIHLPLLPLSLLYWFFIKIKNGHQIKVLPPCFHFQAERSWSNPFNDFSIAVGTVILSYACLLGSTIEKTANEAIFPHGVDDTVQWPWEVMSYGGLALKLFV